MGIGSWVKGEKNGARGMSQPPPPSFEQLEPRLLLSADLIPTAFLNPFEISVSPSGLLSDLTGDDQASPVHDTSLILTYLASADNR
jgi:hypothetical protein